MKKDRAGKYVKQPAGYKAYMPSPLPPDPTIQYDDTLQNLLSEADRSLARLDGITSVLPNPELFVAMYVKKEALLSSQIEGTEASLEGILEFEANLKPSDDINEIKEVVNYIKALNYGVKKLPKRQISTNLIKETHRIVTEGARGTKKTPGQFKTNQNWIGPPNTPIIDSVFVPPPPEATGDLMGDLVQFIQTKDDIPPLIKIGLIHVQFETIHPFRDGNGRVGRLLITFFLYWKKILSRPLLYLSIYLKKNRKEYYEGLMNVRLKGDWEGWLKFFLDGIDEVSKEAANSAKEIINLKEDLTKKLLKKKVGSIYAVKLINLLFTRPIISVKDVEKRFKISRQSANQLVNKFQKIGIIKEITGKKRYRRYQFTDYIRIIKRGTEL